MPLTPEQKTAVSSWVAAGDNLSAVQKKLIEHFKLSMTYRDVRFLVDDLNLELKDAAPKVDTSDVSKPQPAAPGAAAPAPRSTPKDKLSPADHDSPDADDPELAADPAALDEAEAPPPGLANVKVEVDKATLIPGAIASGSVTFSDGVTGQWVVDQYGRPGFTKISQEGYRPTPDDGQAFMQELSLQLQQRGF
ncbi:MAG: hypothetical protein Q8N18_13740 [Opitutaceae bacterium]|nr:hypothetical protein [Opitutaceae bacterium]